MIITHHASYEPVFESVSFEASYLEKEHGNIPADFKDPTSNVQRQVAIIKYNAGQAMRKTQMC